jgi:APA family basic amino acid/polyamine antiporter
MRDPQKSLGRALALGTLLCIALYLAVNAAYLRAMPVAELATARDPARAAAQLLGGDATAAVLSPLIAVCVLSSMQASVLVGPRIYHAMASDRLFFAPLGKLHPRTNVPLVALVAQGVISVGLLLSGRFDELVRFTMSAIVAFSTLTVGAVIVLRLRRPGAERAFRVPGYPWVPALFIVVNVWMLWNVLTFGDSSPREALIGLAIVATGVPAYAAFRARARPQETPR